MLAAHLVRYVTSKGIVEVTMLTDYLSALKIAASTARHIDATSYSVISLA